MIAQGDLLAAPISSYFLGPFALTEPLGRGAAAEVYKGIHPSGLEVAVKVLTHDKAATPDLVRSFRNEVRAVARLDHPNVVRLFELGVVSSREAEDFDGRWKVGAPWLAMQLCPDGTLTQHKGALPWPHLKRLLLQLLDALGHAHAHGLVHRDVKPGNLLLDGDDLILSDFGLVDRLLEAGTPRPSAGTPAYMAPEQLRGEWRSFGTQTDLYAVGALAWTLISGAPPFGRALGPAVAGHLERPVPALPSEPTPGLDRWIASLMEKHREDRPASAAQAAAMLLDLTEPHATVILPEDWSKPETPNRTELVYAGLGLYALRPPPLIGRVEHRARLWDLLGEALEGGAHTLVLRGPAGVGKSRLAAWLCARAHELGGLRSGRAFHSAIAGPRQGLRGLVRRQLGLFDLVGDALAEGRDPVLAAWLEGRARVGQDQRYAAVAGALSMLTVTWLDDVQWGADALAYARWCQDNRVPGLRVLTVRDGEVSETVAGLLEGLDVLEVGPLDAAESAELVRGLLGLDPSLAAEVQERAGGIPLFAVELVGDWVRRGLLERGPEGWVLSGEAPDLPSDVYGIWRGALERVLKDRPVDDRYALELAAVLGSGSELDEWQDACRIRGLAPTEDLVDVVVQGNLALVEAGGVEFVHGMLRESLELAARRGKRLGDHHSACADALGGRLGPGIDARYADHLVKAGRPLDALMPSMIASKAARAAGNFAESKAMLDLHARALADAEIPDNDPHWGSLTRERSRSALVRGDSPEEERLALDLLERSRRFDWRHHEAFALRELGTVYHKRGRAEEALELLNQGLDIALELDDEGEAARCWWNLGLARQRLGNLSGAAEMLTRAVRFGRAANDMLCEAGAQLALADVYCQTGQLGASERAARGALGLFAREHTLHGQGGAYNSLGEVARAHGKLEVAEGRYLQARKHFHEARSPDEHVAELNLALTCTAMGRHADALEWLDRCDAGLTSANWEYLRAGLGVFRLPSLAALQRFDETRDALACARRDLAETGFKHTDCVHAARTAAATCHEAGEHALAGALEAFAKDHEAELT